MIPTLPDSMNVLVIGPVASGKSWLLDQWQKQQQALLWFDTTGEIDETDESFTHIYRASELTFDRSFWHWFPRFSRTRHRICFHPSNIIRQFSEVLREYWKLENPRKLIVDECQEISHLEVVDTALRFARKRLLGFVGATQRIVDVSTTYRANARMIVFFHTSVGNDYQVIRESWGDEISEMVRALRPLIYNDVTKQVLQTPQCLVYFRGMKPIVFDL